MGRYEKEPDLVAELRRLQTQVAHLSANPPVRIVSGAPTHTADDGHLAYDKAGGTLYVRSAGSWAAV